MNNMLKGITLLLALLAQPCAAYTDPGQPFIEQSLAATGQKNWSVARDAAARAVALQPENGFALLLLGNAQIGLRDIVGAKATLTKAWYADNSNHDTARLIGYLELIGGNGAAAREWVSRSLRLMATEDQFAIHLADCDDMVNQYGQAGAFNDLKAFSQGEFNRLNRGRDMAAIKAQYGAGVQALNGGNPSHAETQITQAMNRLKSLPSAPAPYVVSSYAFAVTLFLGANDAARAQRFLQVGLDYQAQQRPDNPLWHARLVDHQANLAVAYAQPQRAIEAVDRFLAAYPEHPFPSAIAGLVNRRINARLAMPEPNRAAITADANLLLKVAANAGGSADYFRALGYNALTVAALMGNTQADRDATRQAGEQALALATAGNFADILPQIWSNMAIIHFRGGDRARGLDMARRSAEQQRQAGNYIGAVTALNNLGAMLLFGGQPADAVAPLQEAVQFVENHRANVPVDARIDFIGQQVSAYQFLAMAYGKLNQAQPLYDTLENSRGRVLAETMGLGRNLARADVAWVQQNLRADEAAVLFGVTEPGAVAISVVTREGVRSVYSENRQFMSQLRTLASVYQKAFASLPANERSFNPFQARGMDDVGLSISLLREIMQAEEGHTALAATRDQVLALFHQLLVAPVEPLLAGKTRLVISADEYLSFVPFEALRDNRGQYLIQRYAVRYTPSMTVWRAIAARKYPPSRKPILAFGGAIYEPYTASTPLATDEPSFRAVQRSVLENFRTGRSQRANYAAIGVTGQSWSYLPGTLKEVAVIQQTVPGVTALYAQDFSEARIKAMSRSGELAQYKVLHLATHGMVVPTLPELSTVITSLPMTEQGGEDGYLAAGEIKDLKLQADFVALSACETGLGKVYAGEGVGGLTRAFLQAGANGMSVSLWAISDAATMMFMAGLYNLAAHDGMNYADAMADMKRRFIAGEFGEENRHPNFWAPFAYYGI